MKFLHFPQLGWVNAFLNDYSVGNEVLNGQVDAYSLKLAGMYASVWMVVLWAVSWVMGDE